MSGFDILSLVGEPWADSAAEFRGIGVTVTDTASLPSSKFLEFVLNGAPIYSVLKTGETIVRNAAGTSLGGFRLAGNAGEMALTSQVDAGTGMPAEALRYSWEDTAHVGNDPASGSVLQGMGASNFSIEGAAKITHIAGSSAYVWAGVLGSRLVWTGYTAATADGRTIDFSNVGQTNRASPILSVSAANVADDLIHFGLSDGTNWSVAAKIDAAGRGRFQMLDLPEQGAPGNPAASTARIYGKSVGGVTKVAFRDSSGAETVLGSTITVAGGTVTTSTPLASFTQTWNDATSTFRAIATDVTDTGSRFDSKLIDLKVDSGTVFQVRKTGETIISNKTGTSLGGMALLGGAGEMAMTSQIDPNTGRPAEVFRYYWEGAVGQVSVIRGSGKNRLSIESAGAIVHGAATGRYEFEGYSSPRLSFVGYEIGSSVGKPFDFNNNGQSVRTSPVVSVSTQTADEDALHICRIDSSGWTTLSRFDGTGMLHVPRMRAVGTNSSVVFDGEGAYIEANGRSGSTPGFIVEITGEMFARSFFGLDAHDDPFMSFGMGTNARDAFLIRDEADVIAMRNGAYGDTPQEFRTYNKYSAVGANRECGSIGWKTATNWFRLGTTAAGTGVARNLYLDPAGGIVGICGTTAAFPALKRVATRLQAKLADDSDFCPVQGRLTTHANATAETVTPDMTLTLYDAAGTAYKVPCVAA